MSQVCGGSLLGLGVLQVLFWVFVKKVRGRGNAAINDRADAFYAL